ncbi:MAG TPA: hypothetical protein VN516_06010 [Candidatus Baltobacteraceae bacterium]|nr:hypothetical protein [Candidatus Baltobacteraceae bacterium]
MKGKDLLSKARRSWNMSRIRGKNTKPEMVVRSMLHKMGYRFRLHVKIPIPENLLSAVPRSREREIPFAHRMGEGGASRMRAKAGQVRVVGEKQFIAERNKVRCRIPEVKRRRFIIPDIVLPKYKTAIFVHGCNTF